MPRTQSPQVKQAMIDHVSSYFEEWATDVNKSTAEVIAEQVNSMRPSWGEMRSTETVAREIVEGGTLLVYYYDVKDFLNGLGINPNNKEYDDQVSWELYITLCTRAIKTILGE